jgi:hypothetical protein
VYFGPAWPPLAVAGNLSPGAGTRSRRAQARRGRGPAPSSPGWFRSGTTAKRIVVSNGTLRRALAHALRRRVPVEPTPPRSPLPEVPWAGLARPSNTGCQQGRFADIRQKVSVRLALPCELRPTSVAVSVPCAVSKPSPLSPGTSEVRSTENEPTSGPMAVPSQGGPTDAE